MKPTPSAVPRRDLLLSALVSGVWACEAGAPSLRSVGAADAPAAAPPSPAAPSSPPPPPAPPPTTSSGLEVIHLGSMPEGIQGGHLLVLLHGWGAPGDDLVSLTRELARQRRRFLVPAAPLAERGGGRAWWHIGKDRPAKVSTDVLPANHHPSAAVAEARRALQTLLREARERYAPSSISIAGFSQGAQLALDVGLAADPRVDHVAVLSGALLADSLPALRASKPPLPAVFVSHGRTDRVLPFSGGESIQSMLERRGYPVTFFPFDGGHEIPPSVVAQLRQFLSRAPG